MKIGKITLGVCMTNCYFVYDEEKKEAIVFDPADRGDYLYEKITASGFVIKAIFLTHGHFDHIWGSRRLKELADVPIYAYEGEKALCENARLNVSEQAGRAYTVSPDVLLRDGETVTAAGLKAKVIATPGHTAGSCCYYFEKEGILISGDTLFQESIGRTDLATGNTSAILRSIKEKLMVLPQEVKVYPGHGDDTTIGYEKRYNPYCR